MAKKNEIQIIRKFIEPNEEDIKRLEDLADYLVNLARRLLSEESLQRKWNWTFPASIILINKHE